MTAAPRRAAALSRRGLLALLLPAAAVVLLAGLAGGLAGAAREAALVSACLYGAAGWGAYLLARAAAGGRGREVALAALSLCAAALAGELALRLLRPYESLCRFRWLASARLHHVNPPARRMFAGRVEGAPIVVSTNEDGFRTPHSRASFLAHPVRIAVLGDSFVFGSGVNAEQAFPARLEERLRARPQTAGAAVLNAGVISYSPLLEGRLFEEVVGAYRPHLVLLFLDATDIGDDAIYARKAGGEGGSFPLEGDTRLRCYGALHQLLEPYLDWLGTHLSFPARQARAVLGAEAEPAGGGYYADPVLFEGREENRFFIYRHPLERTEPFFWRTLGHVERLAAAAGAAGARFALVVVPRYHHWSDSECPDNWERGVYFDDEPFEYEYFRFFARAAAAAPFPILDLLPAFRASTGFPLVFRNDPHWNARGHELVARTIEEALLAQGLLAGPGPGAGRPADSGIMR